jgi:hypothetical protein
MGSVLLIINALFPLVINELQSSKAISANLASLISGIERAASEFATDISSSPTTLTVTATSLLAAISAATQALQATTTLSPVTLSIIEAMDKAIAAGLSASSVTIVDPTQLKPIAPVA